MWPFLNLFVLGKYWFWVTTFDNLISAVDSEKCTTVFIYQSNWVIYIMGGGRKLTRGLQIKDPACREFQIEIHKTCF